MAGKHILDAALGKTTVKNLCLNFIQALKSPFLLGQRLLCWKLKSSRGISRSTTSQLQIHITTRLGVDCATARDICSLPSAAWLRSLSNPLFLLHQSSPLLPQTVFQLLSESASTQTSCDLQSPPVTELGQKSTSGGRGRDELRLSEADQTLIKTILKTQLEASPSRGEST